MPEANKIKKDEMKLDIDTSGPEAKGSLKEENIEQVATVKETTKEEIIKGPVKTEYAPEESSEQSDVQVSETIEN